MVNVRSAPFAARMRIPRCRWLFQGFLWNLNNFDQAGVQLGKVLAKRVLAHDTDGALAVYSEMLGI